MKRFFVWLFVAMLGGCSTATDTAFTNSIVTLTKAGCHLTVNIAASAGAVNPGSGVQFQGSADCPGASTVAPLAGARLGEPAAVERAAPTATFLKN